MQQATPIWTRITWRHPQWWLFPVSMLAWLAMGFHTFWEDALHHHHHTSMMPSWGSETYCWMLMVAAMMLPLISDSARNVAARSLWYRRQRAIVGFVLGYLSVWLVAGIAISLLLASIRSQSWFDSGGAMVCFFVVALAWQTLSVKKRVLIACHRTRPIAPEGLKANWDCLRYGCMIGGSCLLNCWAWMLFCTLAGHQLLVMAFAMVIGTAERYPIQKIPRIALSPSALFALLR